MTISAGLRKTLYVVVLLLIAAVFLTPYIFSIFAAFKPLSEIQADRAWQLPSHFTWDNFVTIFTQYHFATYLANTVAVTVILTIGQVGFSLLGAYAFARIKFPGREAIFWGFLAMLMVPNVVTMIPLYIMMSGAGLVNTYWALFLPYVFGTPYTVFLGAGHPASHHRSAGEAGHTDGHDHRGDLRVEQLPVAADRNRLERPAGAQRRHRQLQLELRAAVEPGARGVAGGAHPDGDPVRHLPEAHRELGEPVGSEPMKRRQAPSR